MSGKIKKLEKYKYVVANEKKINFIIDEIEIYSDEEYSDDSDDPDQENSNDENEVK